MKLTLVSKNQEAADVITFIFKSGKPLNWKAGQFLHYMLPHANPDDRGDERWFTISTAPFQGFIGLTTRINSDKSSSFKTALCDLSVNDQINVDPPEGDFVIEDFSKDYLLIAGGIGITPFHSILMNIEHAHQNLKATLLYANHDNQFVFQEDIDRFQGEVDGFSVQYIIEPDKITLDSIKEAMETLDNPKIYISGPEPMVEHYRKLLIDNDIAESRIVGDYFPGYN